MTKNKKLREDVDNMRRQRILLENIKGTLEKEINGFKKEIGKMMIKMKETHESKEDTMAKITQIKMAAEKEQMDFESEWKSLSSIIEADRKTRVIN